MTSAYAKTNMHNAKYPTAEVVKSIEACASVSANVREGNPKRTNVETRPTWKTRKKEELFTHDHPFEGYHHR
ncbi:MAG: hypothetical protein HC938_03235 [Nitrospira sp.]|nr:hypothetical protein [Nitrospira sp.]